MAMTSNNVTKNYSATRTFAASRTRTGYTILSLTGTNTVAVGQGGDPVDIPNGASYIERNNDISEFTVTTTGTYTVITNEHQEA